MGRHCRASCTPPALRFDFRHAFHRSEAYRDWPSCSNNSRKRRSMPMGWQRCGFKRHGHARKRKRPRHVTRSTGPCCYERGRYTSHPCRQQQTVKSGSSKCCRVDTDHPALSSRSIVIPHEECLFSILPSTVLFLTNLARLQYAELTRMEIKCGTCD